MVFLAGMAGWNQRETFDSDDIGRHYPAMTVVEVSGFVEDGARVEIETTAMIPD